MQHIKSRDNERVKRAVRIAAGRAAREAEGLLFAEGARLCADLALSLEAREIFITEQALAAHPTAETLAPDVFLISAPVADKLAGTKSTQGFFGVFAAPRAEPAGIAAEDGVLLCEAVADAANLGALIRSAAGLGLGGVTLAGACADPYSPRALRGSMGAAARIPVAAFPCAPSAAAFLRGLGAHLYAAAVHGAAAPLASVRARGAFALMVGSEGAGLSPQALAEADEAVYVPMSRGVESLNVAAAAAVMMYHLKTAE